MELEQVARLRESRGDGSVVPVRVPLEHPVAVGRAHPLHERCQRECSRPRSQRGSARADLSAGRTRGTGRAARAGEERTGSHERGERGERQRSSRQDSGRAEQLQDDDERRYPEDGRREDRRSTLPGRQDDAAKGEAEHAPRDEHEAGQDEAERILAWRHAERERAPRHPGKCRKRRLDHVELSPRRDRRSIRAFEAARREASAAGEPPSEPGLPARSRLDGTPAATRLSGIRGRRHGGSPAPGSGRRHAYIVASVHTSSDQPAEDTEGRPTTLPLTVVIPTIGRLDSLRACLQSLAACRPLPDETIVVDQSHDPRIAELVASTPLPRARVVHSPRTGVAAGRNEGLRAASHDVVLVTDDDCTVQERWVHEGWRQARRYRGAIVTGRVLPVGDAAAVPSTKDEPLARDFTGVPHGGALFPNNVVLPRLAVLDIGGFDERFGPEEAAEDNEFCYRWLRAGGALRYEPELVVWHHDWRSPAQLERLYVRYARGQGFFYAKYLRQGDLRMLRWIARDLYWAARGYAAALLKRRPRWTDPRRGILRGLPGGFFAGWRAYGR